MNAEVSFSRATLKELSSLVDLRLMLLKEMGEMEDSDEKATFEKATKEYLQTAIPNGEFIAYLAVSNGETVGTSGIVIFRRPPYPENLEGLEAYILNMYTVPEYRGRGMAKKLLELCLEECRKLGVKRIWLHASADGKPLYERMGFTDKGNEMELFFNRM